MRPSGGGSGGAKQMGGDESQMEAHVQQVGRSCRSRRLGWSCASCSCHRCGMCSCSACLRDWTVHVLVLGVQSTLLQGHPVNLRGASKGGEEGERELHYVGGSESKDLGITKCGPKTIRLSFGCLVGGEQGMMVTKKGKWKDSNSTIKTSKERQ